MEIIEISDFLNYFEKVRGRTIRVAKCIPAQNMEWSHKPGAFTYGDIIRHLACIERFMYAENAQFKPSKYSGCGVDLMLDGETPIDFLARHHAESVEIFSSLTSKELNAKTITPGGAKITLWKWLRLMAEHEIHHRGQLYFMLGIQNIPTPPLYGLTAEEVEARKGMI